jgi:BirA family biotin operon repressor/biotin-[acetyl-CoA-carboxylase] ligase
LSRHDVAVCQAVGVDVDVVLGERERLRLLGSRFAAVEELEEVTSTNSVLADMAAQGAPEGLVLVASYQSAGRGRLGRRWEAPPGACLLFSVLMRPPESELAAKRRHLAVGALSLAMADAAREVAGVELWLKWPNDLVSAPGTSKERKVAGVLAEVVAGPAPAVVAGMGVNVHWAPSPALLKGRPAALPATSVEALAGHPVSRGELLASCLLALDRLYGDWPAVARRYRESCATLGRQVQVGVATGPGEPGGEQGTPGQGASGLALDIDDEGALVVRTRSGQLLRVAAGDVVHVRAALTSSL